MRPGLLRCSGFKCFLNAWRVLAGVELVQRLSGQCFKYPKILDRSGRDMAQPIRGMEYFPLSGNL